MNVDPMMALAESQTRAAWFQAWGSIGAIVAGFAAVLVHQYFTHRDDRRRAEEALSARRNHARELLRAMKLGSNAAIDLVKAGKVGEDANTWRRFARANLIGMQNLKRVAETIDLTNIATAHVWLMWGLLLRGIDQVATALAAQIEWAESAGDAAAPAESERLRVIAVFESLAENCDRTDAIFTQNQDSPS